MAARVLVAQLTCDASGFTVGGCPRTAVMWRAGLGFVELFAARSRRRVGRWTLDCGRVGRPLLDGRPPARGCSFLELEAVFQAIGGGDAGAPLNPRRRSRFRI